MDSTPSLPQLTEQTAGNETTVNELVDALSPAAVFGRNPDTTTGLTWGYLGGRWGGVAVAAGTVALTGSNTNYVVVNRSSGAVSVSTSTANWQNLLAYARLYKIVAGASAVTSYEDWRSGPAGPHMPPRSLTVAAGDETTAVTTGTAKVTFRMPGAMTVTDVRGGLSTAQSSGSIFTMDVNEGGASILSTKLTIDNGEKTSTTAATPPVLSDTALADDAEITIDVDQVGDGTAKGPKVTLVGY